MKNKIVFGIGDRWGVFMLIVNMGFVRVVVQLGMFFFIIEYSFCVFIGDQLKFNFYLFCNYFKF